jgi:CubicO group peptidase (beta-lactamase class C family)
MDIRSRTPLLFACALAMATGLGHRAEAQTVPWPTDGWEVASFQSRGLVAGPFAALHGEIEAGVYGYVDRLVVVKDGYLVMSERYQNDYREISRGLRSPLGCGVDACDDDPAMGGFNYLHPDWHPYYQGRDVHTLQSVTKSVTSALIGIAIRRGEISGTEAPLLTFFQEYDLSGVEERLHRATLDDLLTMRSGIEWHENDRPLDDTNTTLQLERSQDWIQFTLDQPMDSDPGQRWNYNSGGSHLMSGVIRSATGHFVDAYAEEHLFGPLGIDDHHWKKSPRGYPDTEGGLYLEAEDLARIGYLYLRDGVWNGRRILPEGWVAASTTRRVELPGGVGWGYGYQWWLLEREGVEIWAGQGFGGQYLIVMPEHDLVGVANSWNIFGDRVRPILTGLVEAMLASVER